MNFCGLGLGPVAESREQGNEHSGFLKGGKFLDYLCISFSRRILLHEVSLTSQIL
jgi:hypothetical protein